MEAGKRIAHLGPEGHWMLEPTDVFGEGHSCSWEGDHVSPGCADRLTQRPLDTGPGLLLAFSLSRFPKLDKDGH